MAEIANEDAQIAMFAEVRRGFTKNCVKPIEKNNLRSAYGLIYVDLVWLATGILRSGALLILSGDENGWNELRRGFLYDSWAARFRH